MSRGMVVVAALGLALGLSLTPGAARADVVDDGEPGMLWIDASPVEIDHELEPGERVYWQVSTHLSDATDGELHLTVRHSGVLSTHPGGLTIEVRECSVPWQVPGDTTMPAACAGAVSSVISAQPFAALAGELDVTLGDLANGAARHFLATIAFPDPAPAELQGESAQFELEFRAAGDVETLGGPDDGLDLAFTGAAFAAPLVLAGALLALGALLRLARSRSEERAG